MNFKKALILIAHGSREAETQLEMNALVESLQDKLTDLIVSGAFMEIQDPDLCSAVKEAVEKGAVEIDVLPLFIFKGRHMKEDIPAQIQECKEKFGDCSIKLLSHLAVSSIFADMIAESVRIS